jgi:outer membrane receptor for ferrienterochelin and colicin
VAQGRAATETQLRDDQQAFTQYKISVVNSGFLLDEAAQLRTAGLAPQAQVLEDEANAQRETAENLASRTFDVRFVTTADDGNLSFDVDARRAELQALNRDNQRLNPDLAAAKAVELRKSSQWKVAWVVGLVGVILVLTLAQISRHNAMRYAMASLAVVLFVGFAVAGFSR